MNLFSVFKNQLQYGQAGVTAGDATTPHPVNSEVLVEGVNPITAEFHPVLPYTSLTPE